VQITSGSFRAIDHNSQTVNFGRKRNAGNKLQPLFDAKPAVFGGLLTLNGTHPGIVAVKGINRHSAAFHVDEPSCYSRASHGGVAPHPMTEQLDWFAISKGVHATDEGRPFVVGETIAERGDGKPRGLVTHAADTPDLWTKVDFPTGTFTDASKDIIVLVQAESKKEGHVHDNTSGDRHWHNMRVRSVTRSSFEFHIENDQYAHIDHEDDKIMGNIKVSYMAIESCREQDDCHIKKREYNAFRADKLYDKITHEKQVVAAKDTAPLLRYSPVNGNPLVFASISHNGADTAVMRIKNKKKGNMNQIEAQLLEPTGINEGQKCNWDNTHPVKEDVYMFLLADSYRCDVSHCADWECRGEGGWCDCFDDSKSQLYEDFDCVGDDDDECDCTSTERYGVES
jgi:hypothetical protein